MKTIPQRVLRNQISRVLRQVESGERIRVTTNGRPVADLVPITDQRPRFLPREELLALLKRAPLDKDFERDRGIGDATIDEL
jgi:prevent-host-death family protein